MNITAPEIGMAVGELSSALEGAFPHKVFQTGREEWVLEFRKGSDRLWLLFSISARNGRIHLVNSAPASPLPMEGFARTMKKTILRGKLLSIRQVGGDRVVHLIFGGGGQMTLVVEIMGTAGNAYLLDHEEKVGAMAHPRKGKAELGAVYLPPVRHEHKGPAKEQAPLAPAAGERFPVNRALELRHQGPAMEEKLQDIRALITQPMREEMKKMERHAKNLEEELASLKGFQQYRKLGDLIKANYHAIKKGAQMVEVEDLFSPGMEKIIIPLDPARDVEKNADGYYKKYRKFEKGSPRITGDLAALGDKLAKLRQRMEQVTAADSLDKLAEFLPKEEDEARKPARGAKAAAPRGKKEQKRQTGPKQFISSEGHLILVGRNDQENDELTFKIANGRDLWLHARDYPGSHVIARMPKGAEPSRKTLQEAAMIALHYSKAAKAGKGEVTWCLAKDVKKPKGAPPGKVLVHGAKSVAARIDEAAIKAMKEKLP
ncbi:MAG: NFACT family protein [Nitrospinota bacterium]|nr:NFACT family protein [Nitrospinota bacterium]